MSVDGRDVLCTGLESIESVAVCESEDGVGGHDVLSYEFEVLSIGRIVRMKEQARGI